MVPYALPNATRQPVSYHLMFFQLFTILALDRPMSFN